MKRCPTCNRTYTDDALSFCLDDGAPLLTTSDAPPSFDPNATMRYTEPRDTSSTPPPTEVYRPGPPSDTGNQIINPSWATLPGAHAAPPPKRRSLLPWIIGGSLLLVVLGIGVVVLLAVLVSFNSNDNTNRKPSAGLTNANNTNSKNANDNSNSSAALTDDFTDAKWLTGNFSNGSFWYQNGGYHMRATANRSVVVYAPDKETYYTQDSTVRVTVRSVSGATPSYGYGVAVLGKLNEKDQLEDYSFLIFTGNDPQYKVALHKDGEETPIVSWTRSSTIRTGSTPNQLEVRLKGDQMSFYINGQYATSVKDTAGYEEGSVGFYTSDTHEVAFDDLEISR
jgi:hypothetical protein